MAPGRGSTLGRPSDLRPLLRPDLRRPAAGGEQRRHLPGPAAGRLAHRPGPEDREDRALAGEVMGGRQGRHHLHLPSARRRHLQRRHAGRRPVGQGQLRRRRRTRREGRPRHQLSGGLPGHHGRRPAHRQGPVQGPQRPVPAGHVHFHARAARQVDGAAARDQALHGPPDRLRPVRTRRLHPQQVRRGAPARGLPLGLLAVAQEGPGLSGAALLQGRARIRGAHRQPPVRPGRCHRRGRAPGRGRAEGHRLHLAQPSSRSAGRSSSASTARRSSTPSSAAATGPRPARWPAPLPHTGTSARGCASIRRRPGNCWTRPVGGPGPAASGSRTAGSSP